MHNHTLGPKLNYQGVILLTAATASCHIKIFIFWFNFLKARLVRQEESWFLYRVFHNVGPKIMAYCSQNVSLMDFQNLLGAHQMWSICKNKLP